MSCDSGDRLGLNPCCVSVRMLCLSKWFITCLCMMCSKILHEMEVSEMGR